MDYEEDARYHEREVVTLESVGSVLVSTVELPDLTYETCLFWWKAEDTHSEVVAWYWKQPEAKSGHQEWLEPSKIARAVVEAEKRYRDFE